MIVVTKRLVAIDVEISVSQMIENWKNGNCKEVLEALKEDHPGLTAMFMLEGIRSKVLKEIDCNRIANILIEDRMELCKD